MPHLQKSYIQLCQIGCAISGMGHNVPQILKFSDPGTTARAEFNPWAAFNPVLGTGQGDTVF